MKRLLVFSHRASIFRCLKEYSFFVCQVAGPFGLNTARSNNPDPLSDDFIDINEPDLLERLADIHAQEPFSKVISFNDSYHLRAHEVATLLRLDFQYEPELIDIVNDKERFRKFLNHAGVDTMPNRRVSDANDISVFGHSEGYPLILKPVEGVGSQGVSRINSPSDIEPALARLEAALPTAKKLIEPFIKGRDFSVEAFSEDRHHRIICVTESFKDSDTFIGRGHRLPANIRPDEQRRIEEKVLLLLKALNIRSGPTHTEIVLTENEVHIVETHIRLAGAMIPRLIAELYGIDMLRIWVQQLVLGSVIDQLNIPESVSGVISIWYGFADRPGTLIGIEGADQAFEIPAVVDAGLKMRVNSPLTIPFSRASQRTTFAIALHPDPDRSIQAAATAIKQLRPLITSD